MNHPSDQQNATDVGTNAAPSADLAPGTRLGHYRIDALVGRGGSGTVYRGTDTKLNRPVAIKFLTAGVADADARRRFRQEAATASALNHPHIVTVYDVGEHDGRQYIVSELVTGGTLEDWCRQAKRSWRQCVELITGAADALAAAHAAGVLHRDVKPGNILIDANGYAKLTDFGLAKLVRGWTDVRAGDGRRDDSQRTRAGVVIGTVAYMSPEQAAGEPLDPRSDVFSFGIVLYELLAGRRPFEAANDLELLKAIAHATPAPLPEHVPDILRHAVDKGLEKEAADRYQTMPDLVADLRRVTRKTGAQPALAPVAGRRPSRTAWFAAAAGWIAIGGAVAFGTLRWLEKPPAPVKRMQFTIPVPGYQINGLAISPDGTRIAYASTAGGTRQIWLRAIDSLEARPVAGADNASAVFWSPDSRYLAFGADGKLKKLDVNGGPAQTITDLPPNLYGGAWGRDGTILYNATFNTFGLTPANGGNKKSWPAQPNAADTTPRVLPEMLRDGDHFLYVSPALPLGSSGRTLFVGSLATGKSARLADFPVGDDVVPNNLTATRIRYADGFVLYLLAGNGGTLSALPFDAAALAVRGAPFPVAEHVAEFSISETGVLVYRELPPEATSRAAGAASEHRLVWVDRRGARIGDVPAPPGYRVPALSPDGRRIAVRIPAQNGLGDVWVLDAERGTPTRLTFDDSEDGSPVWSADGSQIAFNSGRKAEIGRLPNALYRRAASGAGADELLLVGEKEEILVPQAWSPDGHTLLFARFKLTQDRVDLWSVEVGGEHAARPIVESPASKGSAHLSPNGRWLAYSTNESQKNEVVVQTFPDFARGKWQISAQGGAEPRWRSDGRELYYLASNSDLMAVDVDTTGEVLTSATPHVLFASGISQPSPNDAPDNHYDVAPDGQRFLLNSPATAAPPGAARSGPAATGGGAMAEPTPTGEPPLRVIVNWSAGLNRQ